MTSSPMRLAGFDPGVDSFGIDPAKMAAAMLLSLALHLVGYVWWDVKVSILKQPVDAPQSSPVSVRVVLVADPPDTAAAEPVVPAAPKPARREVPRAQPTPQPLRAAPKREAAPRPAAPAAPTAAPANAAAVAPLPAAPAGPTAKELQERYLRDLFAHIERFKFYPAAARRQGMEAAMSVGFLLDRSGEIRNLVIDGGPKLLRHAAEETLKRAAPLPQVPAELTAPLRIEYRMTFALH